MTILRDIIDMSTQALCASHGIAIDIPTAPTVDADSVRRVVGKYADSIGCDASNRRAAINYALRWGENTMAAIAHGKKKADKLRGMQPEPPKSAA